MIQFRNIKQGDILRDHNMMGVWLVVMKNPLMAMLINLKASIDPAMPVILLPRDTDHWDNNNNIDNVEAWEKEIIDGKKDIIEMYQ